MKLLCVCVCLEHGEAGVDLRRLPPRRRVPRILRPSEFHELQHRLRRFPAAGIAAGGACGDVDAADGVGAGGVRVGAGGCRCAHAAARLARLRNWRAEVTVTCWLIPIRRGELGPGQCGCWSI